MPPVFESYPFLWNICKTYLVVKPLKKVWIGVGERSGLNAERSQYFNRENFNSVVCIT